MTKTTQVGDHSEPLSDNSRGWVVVNRNHPVGCQPYIVISTFSFTRKEAIQRFISGSGSSWKYWRMKFNFKAEKASMNISTITPPNP